MEYLIGMAFGLVFGWILNKSQMTCSLTLRSLFEFKSFELLGFGFMSIAVSCILYAGSQYFELYKIYPLIPKLFPFEPVLAVLGALLFGVFWCLSETCPGSCLASLRSGQWMLKSKVTFALGLFAAVPCYYFLEKMILKKWVWDSSPLLISDFLHLNTTLTEFYLAILFLGLSYLVAKKRFSKIAVWGAFSGLLVFAATATGGYLGVSGGLWATSAWLSDWLFNHNLGVTLSDSYVQWRIGFILGLIVYGLALSSWLTPQVALSGKRSQNLFLLFFYGIGMSLGGLIGFGCTSGAFIAGVPTLSLMSITTASLFFVTALLTRRVLSKIRKS